MKKLYLMLVTLFLYGGVNSTLPYSLGTESVLQTADTTETEIDTDTTFTKDNDTWWKMDKEKKKKKTKVKSKEKKEKDNEGEDWEEWEWNWGDDWDVTHDMWNSNDNPTISVMYTGNSYSQEYLSNLPGGEIRLGYGGTTVYKKYDYLTKYKASYLSYSNISTQFGEMSDAAKYNSKVTRFGIGWDKGIGYNLGGNASINFYNTSGMGWSKLQVLDSVMNTADYNYLRDYTDSYRFGIRGEAGVSIAPIPNLAFTAGYERAIVYPRVLFWKTAGSLITEGIAGWAVEEFVDRVLHNSPAAAPVINFVLKSALIYGVYELRRDEANFPFGGVTPVAHDTYKFGISFIF